MVAREGGGRRSRCGVLSTVLAAGTLALLAGCANSPPSVVDTFWQMNLVRNPGSGQISEALSFFVDVRADGGIKDLDSIYLLSDAQELYWRLDSSNWVKSERDGRLWVGSNQIEMNDRSPLPRGVYRVMVTALSGERAVRTFDLSTGPLDPAGVSFPRLAIGASALEVSSAFASTTVWVYNRVGELIAAKSGVPGRWALASLLTTSVLQAEATTLVVYAYDEKLGCGVISGPYAF